MKYHPTEILIVEDEPKVSKILEANLKHAQYTTHVLDQGDTVIPWLLEHKETQLILLDVMLPGKSGVTLCQEIRDFSQIPIIMLTAKASEVDRLLGLNLGADDYICKPFSPREVVARVQAVLRRTHSRVELSDIEVGPIRMNPESLGVWVNGQELKLTAIQFKILKAFMESPNKVFSRNELIQRVQGYDFEGYERVIDSHIKNIRKAIASALPNQNIIISVYGVGYKMEKS